MGRDQKINICHIISGDLWAGAEVQADLLLRALSKMPDLAVRAIVLNEGKLVQRLREADIEVNIIDESQHGFFALRKLMAAYLKDKNIDILHSHRRKENVLAGYLKRDRLTRHLVQTVHGSPEPFTGLNRLKEKVYAAINNHFTKRYFDRVLPVSHDIKMKLLKRIDSSRLITIHNSIDPSQVEPSRGRNEIRAELGLDANAPVIGSAGRMVPVKQYDQFLKAAAIMLKQRPDARFLIAGEGPQLDNLKELAAQLSISEQVLFVGFRSDMPDILSALDIFVISSKHEGIPMVVLEAMILQRAVVSTKVGGMPEIIENDLSGLLVKPSEPQQLASACLELLSDRELAAKIGAAAQKRIETKFSISTQARRVADIYRELTKKKDLAVVPNDD